MPVHIDDAWLRDWVNLGMVALAGYLMRLTWGGGDVRCAKCRQSRETRLGEVQAAYENGGDWLSDPSASRAAGITSTDLNTVRSLNRDHQVGA